MDKLRFERMLENSAAPVQVRRRRSSASEPEPEQPIKRRSHVVFVHGTFAGDSVRPGQYAAADGAMAGLLKKLHNADDYSTVQWSGEANQLARLQGSFALTRHVKELLEQGIRVHLVAHSHGGNVCGYALQGLPGTLSVESVTMLGTPHLQSGGYGAWNTVAASRVNGPIRTFYSHRDYVQTVGAAAANTTDLGALTPWRVSRILDPDALRHPVVINRDVTAHGRGIDHHSSLHDVDVLQRIYSKQKEE